MPVVVVEEGEADVEEDSEAVDVEPALAGEEAEVEVSRKLSSEYDPT